MSSRSLNKVTLIGNLTRDPELKYTPQGTAVCSFGIATNRTWTTKTGETKDEVQFHNIIAWQKLGELCASLLAKGRKVYVEGRITYRKYDGKDGVERNVTEIVIDDFIAGFDGKKGDADSHGKDDAGESNLPDPAEMEMDTKSDKSSPKEDVNPDDIPF